MHNACPAAAAGPAVPEQHAAKATSSAGTARGAAGSSETTQATGPNEFCRTASTASAAYADS
ncbi:hypothetical protein AWC19_02710 [Mycobacterium palustre]|uniref:Uncharacterized protein n=1 Tax=Mycobacterium palustre TaxID=153971 RepID=A0A1X1ZUW3_9MYCO|nr:hypothetical protein AWC19_02710 [Mycobacterium palustre]